LKYLPVSTVSLYAYVNPLIAVLLGTVVLAEPFTARVAVASALVIAGVAIVRFHGEVRLPGRGATTV
jgi:drug/metabolite transporter (DMT)-like permease